jgi:membrane-associated phospholipid phosphatase
MLINPARNYSRLKWSLLILPLCLLGIIVLFLYINHALSTDQYIHLQKNCFFFINQKLAQFPVLQYNLTQLGDAVVFLAFLSILIIYQPKLWEALLSGLLISCLLSSILKSTFGVPRPAAVFDHKDFTIVGKMLYGDNSLPSGHSITAFTIITILMFGVMPEKLGSKILLIIFMMAGGLLIAFSRIAVGAHYPLDVITGSIIGYISGLAGIFVSCRYNIWIWISNKKYYPALMILFLIAGICLIKKIKIENLVIFTSH